MPTALPVPDRRLSWPDTVRFLVLLLRVRRLTRRVQTASRRVGRCGVEAVGDDLLRAARAWLACHAAIAALLDAPGAARRGGSTSSARAQTRRDPTPTERIRHVRWFVARSISTILD